MKKKLLIILVCILCVKDAFSQTCSVYPGPHVCFISDLGTDNQTVLVGQTWVKSYELNNAGTSCSAYNSTCNVSNYYLTINSVNGTTGVPYYITSFVNSYFSIPANSTTVTSLSNIFTAPGVYDIVYDMHFTNGTILVPYSLGPLTAHVTVAEFYVSPTIQNVPSSGGNYSATVTSAPSSYTYNLTIPDSWIHFVSYPGGGAFNYSVDNNSTIGARVGHVYINDYTHGYPSVCTLTINQPGCSASSSPSYISASTYSVCSGTGATLYVVGGSLGTGANWVWYANSCGGSPIGYGSSITVYPSASTTYYVRAEGTCNTTSCSDVTINVNTSSTAPSGVSASAYSLCAGNSTTLSVVGGFLGTGAIWTWYANACGGSPIGYGASITVYPATTTTYFVQATGGCTTTGCANTTITVNPQPSPVTVTGGGSYCGPTTITANNGGDGTIYFEGTTFGGFSTASPATSELISSSGTYVFKAESSAGCWSADASAIVNIYSTPAPVTVTGAGVFCGSTTINASGGTGGTIYFEGTSSGGTSTINPTGSAVITTTGTYYFRSITGGVCAGAEGSVTVTINPLPVVVAGPGASVCAGLSATLNATGASTYTWSPATGLSATSGSSVVATASATTTYTVTGTDLLGCSNVATEVLTVNSIPLVSVSPDVTICSGSATTLAASGASLYTWSPSAGLSASTGSTVNASPSATTEFTVTGTSAAGCINTAMVTVSVNPLPAITVTPGAAICSGSSTTLSATGGVTYTWSPSGGLNSTTGSSVTASPVSTTVYSVVGTDGAGCSNSAMSAVTVNALPVSGSISGSTSVCVAATILLTETATGGVWTTSNSNATVAGGVVTGISGGGDTISYSVTNICGTASTSQYIVVNALADPGLISGPSVVIAGNSILLSESVAGGTWTASNTYATVVTGNVTGNTVGVDTIFYTVANVCGSQNTEKIIDILPPVATISGPSAVCVGSTVNLADSTYGGAWSSNNLAIANISAGGIVTGVSAGAATISYILLTNFVTKTITVLATPSPITVTTYVCQGQTISLNDTSAGGTWISKTPSIATVGSTGVVTGILPGPDTISYAFPDMCQSAIVITVNATPDITNFLVSAASSPCLGNAATVTLNSTSLGSGVFNVTYNLSGANIASGQTSILSMGASSGTFTIPASLLTHTGSTTVSVTLISTAAGCTKSVTSGNTINFTVKTLPLVFSVTGGGTFCSGGVGFHVGTSGSQTGVSYQLYRNGSAIGAPISGSGSGLDWGYQTNSGTYTIVGLSASTMCSVTQGGSATIVANAAPTSYSVTGGGAYCPGGTGVHVGISGSQSGTNYQLYRGGTTLVGYPVPGTGAPLDFGLQTITGTYTVGATTTTGSCMNNMTGSASVSVSAIPVAFSVTGGGGSCSGSSGVHVGLAGSSTGINYQLFLGTSPVGSPLAGTGGALDFGVRTAAGIYTVVATNPLTTCSNTMTGSATITVVGLPNTYSVTGGGNYCSGAAGVHVGLSGSDPSGGNITYTLYCNGASIGSTGGINAPIDFGIKSTPGIYTVLAHSINPPYCSSWQAGSATISVVSPPNAGTISGPTVVHNGGTITLVDTTSGGTWSSNHPSIATISGSGVVTGIAAYTGYVTISYTVSNGTCSVNALYYIYEPGPVPPPGELLIYGNGDICEGETSRLFVQDPGGLWSSGNVEVAIVDPVNGNVTGLSGGIALISYTREEQVVFLPMTVRSEPDQVIVKQASNVALDSAAVFDASAGNGAEIRQLQWFVNNKAVSGATNSRFTSGNLKNLDEVRCDVYGACGTVKTGKTIFVVESQETPVSLPANLVIAPNPNDGNFTLYLPEESGKVDITISELTGKIIFHHLLEGNQEKVFPLQLGVVPKGVYLIKAMSGRFSYIGKLVVQ